MATFHADAYKSNSGEDAEELQIHLTSHTPHCRSYVFTRYITNTTPCMCNTSRNVTVLRLQSGIKNRPVRKCLAYIARVERVQPHRFSISFNYISLTSALVSIVHRLCT